ncbi:MAG: ATP synthase F1 subunit delta [Planctomycetota bacterium]
MSEEAQHIPTVFDTEKASIGDTYAKALIGVGQKNGSTEELLDGLDSVVDAIGQLPRLKSTLESPRVSFEAKSILLDKAFKGKLNKDLISFLKIVTSKDRFDCLGQINGSATRLYDELTGNVLAEVITAQKVEQSVADEIASHLGKALGKKVLVKTSVNPDLIGGMVVRIGDTIHDGSIRSQLNQIRTKAIKKTSDQIRQSLDKFVKA